MSASQRSRLLIDPEDYPRNIDALQFKGGRIIAFDADYFDLTGDVKAALMLSQACHWQRAVNEGHGGTEDGWFWKTVNEWEDECCLTRHEQERARATLRKLCDKDGNPLWQEELRKTPAQLFYHIDGHVLFHLLREAHKARVLESANPADLYAENPRTGTRKSDVLARGKAANILLSTNKTSEITSKTTTTTTSSAKLKSESEVQKPKRAYIDAAAEPLAEPMRLLYLKVESVLGVMLTPTTYDLLAEAVVQYGMIHVSAAIDTTAQMQDEQHIQNPVKYAIGVAKASYSEQQLTLTRRRKGTLNDKQYSTKPKTPAEYRERFLATIEDAAERADFAARHPESDPDWEYAFAQET